MGRSETRAVPQQEDRPPTDMGDGIGLCTRVRCPWHAIAHHDGLRPAIPGPFLRTPVILRISRISPGPPAGSGWPVGINSTILRAHQRPVEARPPRRNPSGQSEPSTGPGGHDANDHASADFETGGQEAYVWSARATSCS